MDVRQSIDTQAEEQGPSAALQQLLKPPLRSEQRTNTLLPRVLTRIDMLVIFLAIVLFIPNASVVQATQGAGSATYFYWIIGALTFLVPGAVIAGQLNRLMPVDGGIYVWTHRALGPLLGFFAAFCAWFPGVLVLLSVSDTILSLLQGIGVQIDGPNSNWLAAPWQQGIVVLLVLFISGWLSTLSLRTIMRYGKLVIMLYGLGILVVGAAGLVWLMSGHHPQVSMTGNQLGFHTQNIVLYGVIVLALLGVEVPLNMSAETRHRTDASLFLRLGPWLVLVAYLICTFAVMVVVPPGSASSTYSTVTAVGAVFGVPVATIAGCIFILFFLFAAVIYNVTFARILFVAALDQRLPSSLARVNRNAAPGNATTTQIIIVVALTLYTYFVGPLLYYSSVVNFSTAVYDVTQAATTVIWCISMVILFLDLPVLLRRFHTFFAKKPEYLIAPRWVLYLCCLVGGAASLLGIWATLTSSWDSTLLPNNQWVVYVGVSSLVCLIVGLIGSAYPRLLSSLNEQTAAARENARLYDELRIAYAKLSELDNLKDAFLTTASHELRTPLTIMQGYLELLYEMDGLEPDMRRSFLNKARRACDELVLLQANIMDASRVKLDVAALHCSRLLLKDVCATVCDLFEPVIIKEQRQISINIPASLTVWADEIRLKQVLRNLFENALRYSPPRTPITITVEEEPALNTSRISVIDCGAGIPLDKQAFIFERFARLERDMNTTIRGSGLGLAIVKQLVEAMHGTITVESSGIPGEGTTFSFTLPTDEPE
ncbi:MAG TPA: amino acid permease [Ktedonobacteraceae bacterium]|nr:amino acid permease [Ktedonobacteraceae bacterium]